jgi:hypothetical protein
VDVSPGDHGGSAWIVRVYRKAFLGKKLVSSDWFLDEQQARQFAEDLKRDIDPSAAVRHLKSRPPGWKLHRPLH